MTFLPWIVTSVLFAGCVICLLLWQRAKVAQQHLQYIMKEMEMARDEAISQREMERHARIEAETEVRLAAQRESQIHEQMKDWEKTKLEHLEAAKASLLKAGSEMSSKLLEDHKRENEAAKKESEHRIRQTTEELHRKFEQVFGSMNVLTDQIKDMEAIRQALLTPSGAGNLGEITLENIFKASQLIKGQDYQLQPVFQTPAGKTLKPDAIVYLPGNNILVIDSKASRFFIELATGEDGSDIQRSASDGLKRTMKDHLKSLVVRDYSEALKAHYREKRKGESLGSVAMLMFLPSETALETLRQIDPQFMDRAWQEHIMPVGPAGLVNHLLHSRMLIAQARQNDNVNLIVQEIRSMLESVSVLHGHSERMGKSLKQAFQRYDDFAKSFNRTFLSRMKKVTKMGISLPKQRSLPPLERHQFITADVDGEASLLEESDLLENTTTPKGEEKAA